MTRADNRQLAEKCSVTGTLLVSASEAECAFILPRTILYMHTASTSEVDKYNACLFKFKVEQNGDSLDASILTLRTLI